MNWCVSIYGSSSKHGCFAINFLKYPTVIGLVLYVLFFPVLLLIYQVLLFIFYMVFLQFSCRWRILIISFVYTCVVERLHMFALIYTIRQQNLLGLRSFQIYVSIYNWVKMQNCWKIISIGYKQRLSSDYKISNFIWQIFDQQLWSSLDLKMIKL